MNKKLSALLAVSAFALSVSACTPEQRLVGKSPGSYESTETVTDANGTTTVKTTTTVVTVDEYGNKKEVVTTKVTKDPKGLMNKTSKKTKEVTEEK
jgi:ABC-type Fe3+-citrate transport system substrate-binding protein